jgi:hypothetical protein
MWNPWHALKLQPHLLLDIVDLPPSLGGGVLVPHADGDVLLLDRALSQVERRCVLAHELIHQEWGSPCGAVGQPRTWDVVVAREEIRVHDEAVRRLVPPDELRNFCAGISDFLAVEPHEVADEFHITEEYAARALFLLACEEGIEDAR